VYTTATINGLAYGLVLMIPAAGWMRGVLGVDAGPSELGPMVGFHAVYGVVLGAFLGAGVLV
jgi:hypothetical protein